MSTELDDDTIRAWMESARPIANMRDAEAIQYARVRDLGRILLSERRAHRETREALQATRDELNRWGMGDFHYGAQPQDPRVVAAVKIADAALSESPAPLPAKDA